jgi:hypothetical protein
MDHGMSLNVAYISITLVIVLEYQLPRQCVTVWIMA